jgi:serine/threonine protein kinase
MNTAFTFEKLSSFEKSGVLSSFKANETLTLRKKYILFEWLYSVNCMFKLKLETFFLAISIFEKFTSIHEIDDNSFIQLYGVTSLLLAAKKEEIFAPEIGDFVFVVDGACNRDEILKAEETIFYTLGCNLEFPNIMSYLRKMSSICQCTYKTHILCKIICLIYCVCCKKSQFPSVVVTSVYYLCKNYENEGIEFQNAFGIHEDLYVSVAKDILKILGKVNSQNDKDSLKESVVNQLKKNTVNFSEAYEKLKQTNSFELAKPKEIYPKQKYDISSYTKPINKTLVINQFISKEKSLGEGTFGQVYKANFQSNDVAVKKFIDHGYDEGISTSFIREASILVFVKENQKGHKNISNVFNVNKRNSIVLELMDSDTKTYYGKNPSIISQPEFQSFVTQELVDGLTFLHSYGFIHRDIKPQNILVKGTWGTNFSIKFADFGAVRGGLSIDDGAFTHEICTLWYRAPEILLGKRGYGAHIDIWSLSCTLYEIFTGNALFCGDCEIDQIHKIFRMLGTPYSTQKEGFPYWEGVENLQEYKSNFPQWKKTDKLELSLEKNIKNQFAKTVILKGLTYNPELRPIITHFVVDIVEETKKLKIVGTPEEEWSKKYRISKLMTEEDRSLIKENILKKLGDIERNNSPISVAELFDYLAVEGYKLMDGEHFFQSVKTKILEFYNSKKEGEKEVFKHLKKETKEFVYAVTGIQV